MSRFMSLICQMLQLLFEARVEPVAMAADRLPRQDLEKGPRELAQQAKIIREQLALLLQPSGDRDRCIAKAYEASKILLWNLWELLADTPAPAAGVVRGAP
jgi:hypothetical protein